MTVNLSKSNLALNTVNCLILNHLKSNEYDYSLSVFMPECGIGINEVKIVIYLKLFNFKNYSTFVITGIFSNRHFAYSQNICSIKALRRFGN
jgi:hypothetical protein